MALKVLRPELAATIGSERFAREIEVAARLAHPHILGLIDSGAVDGFFYHVMPCVEGETLSSAGTRSSDGHTVYRIGDQPRPQSGRPSASPCWTGNPLY